MRQQKTKSEVSEQNKLAHAIYQYRVAKSETECVKCKGRLIPYTMHDEKESPRMPHKSEGMMCINCGDLIDPLVLKHRADNTSTEKDYDAYYDSLGVKNEDDEYHEAA